MKKIEIPTVCPSCNSELKLVKDQLFCRNSLCGAQQQKAVEHFCKTLKIKGLGPASIEKLDITWIGEIYNLSATELAAAFGDKIAAKLVVEIEKSTTVSLNELLPAFGIPLIGRSASAKLCKVITHIDDITEEVCSTAGLGPKATENLITWYETEYEELAHLPFSWETESNDSILLKGIVCISGRLSSYKTKAEAEKVLTQAGYIVKSTLTQDVNYLINESGLESGKTKKARTSGVEIINNLNNLIGL